MNTRYRKKPVVIEAVPINYGMPHTIPDEFRAQLCDCDVLPNEYPTKAHVHTLEGPLAVRDGDWLIKGGAGAALTQRGTILGDSFRVKGLAALNASSLRFWSIIPGWHTLLYPVFAGFYPCKPDIFKATYEPAGETV